MEKRYYGIETEYACMVRTPSGVAQSNGAIRDLFRVFFDEGSIYGVWLENGGLFYQDGAHPEYCTPECLTPRQLAVWDAAGDIFLHRIVAEANTRIRGGKFPLILLKDNRDRQWLPRDRAQSYGCHENYLLDIRGGLTEKDVALLLGPFFLSSYIWDGSGCLRINEGTGLLEFTISQRADFMRALYGHSAMEDRAFVVQRNNHHIDRDFFHRLHIISGDSHRSQFVVWLRAAIRGLLIRMAEEGQLPVLMDVAPEEIGIFDYPLYQMNRDETLRKPLWLTSEGTMSSIEVQQFYLKLARDYFLSGRVSVSREEREALDEWQRVLYWLSEDPSCLNREIEWLIKLSFFDSLARKKGVDWRKTEDRHIQRLFVFSDIDYQRVSGDHSLYDKLVERGLVREFVSSEEIRLASFSPPEESRAYWRTRIVDFLERRGISYGINWGLVRCISDSGDSKNWYFPALDGQSDQTFEQFISQFS